MKSEAGNYKRPLALAIAGALALTAGAPASADFPAVLPLSDLNGDNGFKINGEPSVLSASGRSGYAGWSVSSAGDINGDGIDDVIVGAHWVSPSTDPEELFWAGRTYIVFGQSSDSPWPAEFELSNLDGTNGFRLDGEAIRDYSGFSVSAAGDVNGDGIDDLIVGAVSADPNGNSSGRSYVVFGRTQSEPFPAELELSSLDGSTGFKLNGEGSVDHSGASVSTAGDINSDGIDDLIIGAWGADNNSGRSYVVFGRAQSVPFPAELELSSLDGNTGFKLYGEAETSFSGASVSTASDINGDSIDDLIIGAWNASPNSDGAGRSYVVFGRTQSAPFPAELELSSLDGSTGFKLDGEAGDQSGFPVSTAGDINDDGVDDLIIGAASASPNGFQSGRSYVVFGRDTTKKGNFPAELDLSDLDGTNGFKLDGEAAFDYAGGSGSAAGDVNGDGVDDILLGAPYGHAGFGRGYVVFGQSGSFPSPLLLSDLNGSNGFKLDGEEEFDQAGRSISAAGDINGDGVADIVIGAPYAAASDTDSGRAYLVFGGVTGPGQVPVLTATPARVNFGDFDVGMTAPPLQVTLENTGNSTLELGALQIQGQAAGDFSLAADSCSDQSLAAQDSCTFEVGFTLTQPGPRFAEIAIASNLPSAPTILPLSGNANRLFSDRFED